MWYMYIYIYIMTGWIRCGNSIFALMFKWDRSNLTMNSKGNCEHHRQWTFISDQGEFCETAWTQRVSDRCHTVSRVYYWKVPETRLMPCHAMTASCRARLMPLHAMPWPVWLMQSSSARLTDTRLCHHAIACTYGTVRLASLASSDIRWPNPEPGQSLLL